MALHRPQNKKAEPHHVGPQLRNVCWITEIFYNSVHAHVCKQLKMRQEYQFPVYKHILASRLIGIYRFHK